jgi:hypothetical protein
MSKTRTPSTPCRLTRDQSPANALENAPECPKRRHPRSLGANTDRGSPRSAEHSRPAGAARSSLGPNTSSPAVNGSTSTQAGAERGHAPWTVPPRQGEQIAHPGEPRAQDVHFGPRPEYRHSEWQELQDATISRRHTSPRTRPHHGIDRHSLDCSCSDLSNLKEFTDRAILVVDTRHHAGRRPGPTHDDQPRSEGLPRPPAGTPSPHAPRSRRRGRVRPRAHVLRTRDSHRRPTPLDARVSSRGRDARRGHDLAVRVGMRSRGRA